MNATIAPGMKVIARSRLDGDLQRRAVTEVVDGHDFPVVWVCREDEWALAAAQDRPPLAVPWPADDVRPTASP
jgi:hypothetical protein